MTTTTSSSVIPDDVPSIAEAARSFRSGDHTPTSLTEHLLRRVARHEPEVSAFASLDAASAREQAAAATAELDAAPSANPLLGIPIGIKDLIDVAGFPTTASSRSRPAHPADTDAPVVERLRREGSVVFGKTHTHEFAYGLTTPTTRNPHELTRIPGGSSGGSAAAVAAGFVLGALGTDTGGSIRVPASLTGTVGLKPTFGLVPRTGVIPLSWSLDHVGPIARTVEDAAILLDAIAGPHPGDPASHEAAVRDYGAAIGDDLDGLRIGVPRNFFFDRVADDVETATHAAIERLAERGARLIPVTVPSTDLFHAVQWALMVSEASSYHATSLRTSADLYGDDVRILLEAGEHMLATDYLAGLRARTLIVRSWRELFGSIDLLAAPSTPHTAAAVGQATFDWGTGGTEAVSDAYVRLSAPANLTGRPAISVPSGVDSTGLPIGFQLVGQPFEETRLLRAAAAVEASNPARV